MTDTSSVDKTHSTTEPYPVALSQDSALNGAVVKSAAAEEEEPYTISCICNYDDDDGNTVFCERCETWQHIECYYPGNDVPDIHNCVDCEPRFVDAKRAREQQRRSREQDDSGDRKNKRSGPKSQKKKTLDYQTQTNGFHERSESAPREHPPTKKAKISHRSSASVSSLPTLATLAPDARKRAGSSNHALSPTKSPFPMIPLYSNEFLHLYERDKGRTDMQCNLFDNLPLATSLSSWVTDRYALSQVANGRSSLDIFTFTDPEMFTSPRWPLLSTETIVDSTTEIDAVHPTWKMIQTLEPIRKNEIVGEVRGKIGHLREYCSNPNYRWQELRHPDPFVFFHPQLPIYIDSRQEGTPLRFVRRSCRPNVTMKTYITNNVEYHFCFVAKEDIPANSEITAMWYLDPQLFGSSIGNVQHESGDSVQEAASICISNVLSHFGGCACDGSQNCLLASVDRRRRPNNESGTKVANAKRKKSKTKPTISPVGTNRVVTSRAGSETTKNVEEDDQADSRSSSGSTRAQTQSRDLTPTKQQFPDHSGDSELSARDKRKIAAAEKKFQQLEQNQKLMQRKKGRLSNPPTSGIPTGPATTRTGYFGTQAAVKNHSLSPPVASSPPGSRDAHQKLSGRTTAGSVSPTNLSLPRPDYVECAIQTDLDNDAVQSDLATRRTHFVPLTQRLLKRCHADRIRLFDNQRPQTPPLANLVPGHKDSALVSSSGINDVEDVKMMDVDSSSVAALAGPAELKTQLVSSSTHAEEDQNKPALPPSPPPLPLPPPPLPSTLAHSFPISSRIVNGAQAENRPMSPISTISTMVPPVTGSPGHNTSSSPQAPQTELLPSTAQSQSSSALSAPSPVKKKLSLGDYFNRRSTLVVPSPDKKSVQGMTAPLTAPVDQQGSSAARLDEDSAVGPLSIGATNVPMKDLSETTSTQLPSVSS